MVTAQTDIAGVHGRYYKEDDGDYECAERLKHAADDQREQQCSVDVGLIELSASIHALNSKSK